MEFAILVHDADRIRTLRLSGDLDLVGRDTFLDAITTAVADGVSELLIDLGDLAFIDSTGIGALVRARHTADQNSIRYAVIGATGRIADVLTLAGVLEFLSGAAE
ncbi:MAG TPA: STAS domain-containing protein [Micromonosporaceae bacterium]